MTCSTRAQADSSQAPAKLAPSYSSSLPWAPPHLRCQPRHLSLRVRQRAGLGGQLTLGARQALPGRHQVALDAGGARLRLARTPGLGTQLLVDSGPAVGGGCVRALTPREAQHRSGIPYCWPS
jgi:hypothetical protein